MAQIPPSNLGGLTLESLMSAGMPTNNWLQEILEDRHRTFYCQTCDCMAHILPTSDFRPPPAWRSDVLLIDMDRKR